MQLSIHPHGWINLPRILVDPAAHIEDISPSLLCEPGSDLPATAAVMAHHINDGIL
jgi:hypothetical protein